MSMTPRIPRYETGTQAPNEGFFSRAASWLNRHKWKILGGVIALPVLRHLGVFQQLSRSGWSGLRTAGDLGDKVGGKIAQPFSYVGDRMHDAVFGKMEDPTKDNAAQRFYRSVERVFGQDTRGVLAPGGPTPLDVAPRPVPAPAPRPRLGSDDPVPPAPSL